VHNF